MSLLALIAAHGGGTDPGTDPGDGESYTMPTAAPWNAPTHLALPTYDGSDQVVHPDVIDFGPSEWNGHRYWMAMTPFQDATKENPSILVSDRAATGWAVPEGLVNPIYPAPQNGWNSDTDLAHDPVTDELILIYRGNPTTALRVARSADGVTWPSEASIMNVPALAGGNEWLSPALVRMGPTDWRLYLATTKVGAEGLYVTTTSNPGLTSGWTPPVLCTLPLPAGRIWHHDVIRDEGMFYGLIYCQTETGGNIGLQTGLLAVTSRDGVEWASSSGVFMTLGGLVPLASRPSGWADQPDYFKWDGNNLYRATFTPHENGTHFRLWYSANGDGYGWHVGYVRVPRSLWPAPPA